MRHNVRPYDSLFGALFYVEGCDLRLDALSALARRVSQADVWSALSPEQISRALEGIRAIGWIALEAAVEAASVPELKYLPDFEGFEMHINNHKTHLAYALKREAGALALTSA